MIAERINNGKPLLLDGAMGSLLEQLGYAKTDLLWSSRALLENPNLVKEIHSSYILSGADILTTNTFRTNPYALKHFNLSYDSNQLVNIAVRLAKEAKSDRNIIIAGSNAPAEDCYQAERTISKYELYDNHKIHIESLINSNVDFILNETLSHKDEIIMICAICSEFRFPFAVSLFFTENLKLLDNTPVLEALNLIKEYSPEFIGFNCVKPQALKGLLNSISPQYPWGFYLNCGITDQSDNKISECYTPDTYVEFVKDIIDKKTAVIGSCCGSTPNHTKALRDYLDKTYAS